MTTLTLNIQDNSIMPRLLEMLKNMSGVSVVDANKYQIPDDNILSKEEGERFVSETLAPAYRDVLKAEKEGKEFPDISELFKDLES